MSRDRNLAVIHGRAIDTSVTGTSFFTDIRQQDATTNICMGMQTIDLWRPIVRSGYKDGIVIPGSTNAVDITGCIG